MSIQLKQISATSVPTENGGYTVLFALDQEGQLWVWSMRKWKKITNPDPDKDK